MITKEQRAEINQKKAELMGEAQRNANHWNLEHEHEVKPLGFLPAPGKYQGFNRLQRRNGVAKRFLEEKMAKNQEIAARAAR